MTQRIPVYLDCDTGIDDALALIYLLNSPNIDLLGIGTVSGNISSRGAARNTTSLLRLHGRDEIPVAIGAHHPRAGEYGGGSPEVHGTNGIGGVQLPPGAAPSDEPAAELLVRLARQAFAEGRPLTVLAIGPLTNIARALDLEPALPSLIGELVIMGGAVWAPGNVTPAAEANIFHDPEAAGVVVRAGFSTTLVPLDLTHAHFMDDQDAATLARAEHKLHQALGTMLEHYINFYEGVMGVRRAPLHDPLAAAIAIGEIERLEVREASIEVVLDGQDRGRTSPNGLGKLTTKIAMGAPGDTAARIRDRILFESAA